MQLVELVEKDGALEIRLLEDSLADVQEIVESDLHWDAKLFEVLEYHLCSGDWDVLEPYEIDALTSAPILGKSVERDDSGVLVALQGVYWYPNYMVNDPLEELVQYGYVIFEKGEMFEEGEQS